MTIIKIKKNNNQFVYVECLGHTGYGEVGSDILCASISSLVQGCALGIKKVVKLDIDIQTNNDGYYKFTIPFNLTKEQLDAVNVLVNTLIECLLDLQKGYSKYMKLEEI
jgi:uncharacterized protein YsxB (DUF464 family)